MTRTRTRTRTKKISILAALAVAAVATLTACSSAKSYPNQCTLVVGNGVGDNHQVKKIAYPGDSVSLSGDEKQWFVPCNERNYIIGTDPKNSDYQVPAVAYTAASKDGTQPREQIKITLSSFWGLNQNYDTLAKKFAPFCAKYTCYDTSANEDQKNNQHSSNAGWNAMLGENFLPAINRAVNDVAVNFGPDLWSDHAQWTKFSDELGPAFMTEVQKAWQASAPNANFFCGDIEASRNGTCTPVRFVIDNIAPVDPRVQQLANDLLVLEQQKALTDKQIDQAKQKYGSYWQYFLGLQDTIKGCSDKCSIVVGNPGTLPQAQGTP